MDTSTLAPEVASNCAKELAQFILGQTDIRECVPFLINRDNVI